MYVATRCVRVLVLAAFCIGMLGAAPAEAATAVGHHTLSDPCDPCRGCKPGVRP